MKHIRMPLLLGALVVGSLAVIGTHCEVPDDGRAIFVIGERDPFHEDSYVVEMTDPENIAHARAIIENPEETSEQILVCAIERGSGDLPNQDVIGDRAWSWHVSDFIGFADFTIEVLDGWPTYVEENLDDWFSNTGGRIGFWNYTVIREIDESELDTFDSQ